MITLLSFIIVLGVLIFFHELGHFLVAKALRIGVERFSLGFPPKMIGFRRGGTEYCISWVPLGGYVKLRGENPEEDKGGADPGKFFSRPPHQRAAVTLAGPLMNLLLAFLLLPAVFLIGIKVPAYIDQPVTVGWIAPGSPAELAGLGKDDRLLEAGGKPVATWEQLDRVLSAAPAGDLSLRVARADRELTLTLPWKGLEQEESLGLYPQIDPVLGALVPGDPGQKAGLREGDRILSVGGLTVTHWSEMARTIQASGGKSLTIKVRRGEEVVAVVAVPRTDRKTGKGLLGIMPRSQTVVRRYPPGKAFALGWARAVDTIKMTFGFLRNLVTLRASIRELGGPISIFQVTGDYARAGFAELLGFIAFLSLQLAVFNLLPIPVLDGGHILFVGMEAVLRRPLKMRMREIAQQVGLVLLLLLILVVSYNDILRLFAR